MLKVQNRNKAADIDGFFSLSDGKNLEEQASTTLDVQNALKRLEPKERLAVWLKYFNDLTVREIAKEMDISKSYAHSLIQNAEEKLKDILRY
jgi:RNA polymerase sigma factor (sigma-70 family)